METLIGIATSLFVVTYFIVEIIRKVICFKQYQNFTKDCLPSIVKVRYLHPTDSEQNKANEYFAKLYLKPTGLVLIPEMSYVLCPDIFLFVNYKTHVNNFPRPIYLCEIKDLRTTKGMSILISKVGHLFNTNSKFEMIFEYLDDSNLTDKLLFFYEKKNT